MKLSILIVNWNTRDLVIKCVESILKYAPNFDYEIIIVDNHSADRSADELKKRFGPNKQIQMIAATENLGFARGTNLAYKNSTGEYILLLNPDTEVREKALQNLVQYMDANPRVGIVGPKILNPDNTLQASVRRFPGIWSSVIVFSGLHRFFRPRRYLMDDFNYNAEGAVDQVMGAALLTRREIVESLGFLDEKFWLWYEEVDFCLRVKNVGYEIRFYPGAQLMHRGAQGFSQMNVFARKRTVAASLMYYFEKNGSFLDVLIVRIALPIVLLAAKIIDILQRITHVKAKPYV